MGIPPHFDALGQAKNGVIALVLSLSQPIHEGVGS